MDDEEKKVIRREMIQINDDLKRALIPPKDSKDDMAMLENQLRVLDLAFRDVLDNSMSSWGKRTDFSNALRAQNQYRSLFKLRDAIRKKRSAAAPSSPPPFISESQNELMEVLDSIGNRQPHLGGAEHSEG